MIAAIDLHQFVRQLLPLEATDLCALLNHEHVHGENVRATLFTATPSSRANQTIVNLGIRHRF